MSAIDTKYTQVLHDDPWIGHPTVPESTCPDHVGTFRHYSGDATHGQASIYNTPATGAHLIYGSIRAKWAALGWEKGPNGYPTTDEGDATSKKGRFNNFQNGTIIWKSGAAAAFSVHGAIYTKWGSVQFDWGLLGFPVTDETGTPDGIGRFNHFEQGSIYWTPTTGAWIVKGAIRDAWQAQGWERGGLGYPTTDEFVTPNTNGLGRTQRFQGGEVDWSPTDGAKVVVHPVACTIGLDSFQITNTRSLFNDTDFVSVSVAVGMNTPLVQTKALGDKGNGTFSLGMYFQNVHVVPDDKITIAYNMVNSGHQDPGTVIQGLEKATTTLAQKAATAAAAAIGSAVGVALGASIGTAVVPILGTALGALAGWLVGSAWGIIFANCDGPVASAVHVVMGYEIIAAQTHGGMVVRDEHPGVDSATGCGSNSHYFVTWSVH